MTDDTQIHAVVEKITAKFGPHPDVLCNNAGGGESGWSHTAGMSAGLPPIPIELIGNQEAMVAAICQMGVEAIPGEKVSYSPIIAHSILAEVVRRVDGGARPFREILANEVLKPLGMNDTSLGLRKDLAPRRVPIVVRDRSDGLFPRRVPSGSPSMRRVGESGLRTVSPYDH